LTLIGWSLLILGPKLSFLPLFFLLALIGLASGAMIPGFAFIKESVPLKFAGTVSGIGNLGVMIGPMLLQPAIGWVLDQHWKGEMIQGVRIYDFYAYRRGFLLMLAWSIVSAILILFTKETYCRQME
jgi:MFS family permease